MSIIEAIKRVVAGESLTEDAAAGVAGKIMAGGASDAQIAALLIALRLKGESVDEIVGFARAMRGGAASIPLKSPDVIDTCGTGGDGIGTFNISTVAAFVAAGAGCKVAKHGNRSSSSRSGSADVLEALGVDIQLPPERTGELIDAIGVGFLFAPQYHPGARHAAAARREIGVRTIFNAIGPLTHPARAARQLMGVYDGRLTEPMAHVLARLGSVHCLVVHGEDGLDEVTLTGRTWVSELKDGVVTTYSIHPCDFGMETIVNHEPLRGGAPADNARLAREVLGGAQGPRREITLLNAGAAIYVGGVARTLADGVRLAGQSIDSGRALEKLDALIVAGGSGGGARE
jgi:anthranilate phosphoribosyltransferase